MAKTRAPAVPVPEAVGVVTPDLAFKLLCVLGSDTSLNQLYKVLVSKYGIAFAPGPRTLTEWSTKHEWSKRRQKFEGEVNSRIDEQLIDAEVKNRVDQITSLQAIAERSFERVNIALTGGGGVTSDGTPVGEATIGNNLAALERLLGVGLKASTQRNLLMGAPTSISETRQLMADIDDQSLIKRLERKLLVVPGEFKEEEENAKEEKTGPEGS